TQLGLTYDQASLELLDFIPQQWHPLFAQQKENKSLLSLSWFSSNGQGHRFTAEENLFQLRFSVKQHLEDFSTAFRLSEHLATEVADATWTPWAVVLENKMIATPTTKEETLATLYPPQPNPFRESTVLRFYLPAPSTVRLTIRNALGQLIDQKQEAYRNGIHEVQLDALHLSTGIYYVSLEAGNFRSTQKMILLD
ncbi:MAG: T9SS type A sorting domain-containing protein, partial [Bacteroidota bacterium]